jgi:hypothetical protein
MKEAGARVSGVTCGWGGGGFKKYEVSLPDFFDFLFWTLLLMTRGYSHLMINRFLLNKTIMVHAHVVQKKPYSTIMGSICF